MNTTENKRNRSLNFYLNDETADNRVFGSSDISTSDANKHYIILQNDTLQQKCYELEKQKNEIQKICDEFEEQVDTYDESSRYMKNEMKNFIELRKMDHTELLDILKTVILFVIFFRLIDSIIMYFIIYTGYDDLLLFCIADLINISNLICYGLFGQEVKTAKNCIETFNININMLDKTIKQKREEIKKTDDSNDFISKYIDNL